MLLIFFTLFFSLSSFFIRINNSVFQVCDTQRRSVDAVVILGQVRHSSYDATHSSSLHPILRSLNHFYSRVSEADVLIWHEGDIYNRHMPKKLSFTPHLCNLWLTRGAWGLPQDLDISHNQLRNEHFSMGYRFMIRFYSVTIWNTLASLGYKWVTRFDDDSQIYSHIDYNLFDFMRDSGFQYGFRSYSEECKDGGFEHFVDSYVKRNKIDMQNRRYCDFLGKFGFYNNFYITNISWWLNTLEVKNMMAQFDKSGLIFSRRTNDLVFQTAAVKLFLPTELRHHFVDFSYSHHTVQQGRIAWGGIEIGSNDQNSNETLSNYLSTYHVNSSHINVISCYIVDSPFNVTLKMVRVNGAMACAGTEPKFVPFRGT